MYHLSDEELTKLGAVITTREIQQQPTLWQEALENFEDKAEETAVFLEQFTAEFPRVRVIFTGAGTSEYVGNVLVPFLTRHGDSNKFVFESIATTDIVAAPLDYLLPEEPTILVSFARSGNSPESVATVALANQIIKNLRHITITCAPEGQLAKQAESEDNHLLLLMPAGANDQGFAMTGSFTCMTLTGLLVFDQATLKEKAAYVATMVQNGQQVIQQEDQIAKWLTGDIQRIVYLGSGCLSGLTREAQLKVLELTAGKIATVFDSSLGFRHGPKSFVNEDTLVFVFVNEDTYTRQYDVDIIEELQQDAIAKQAIAISQQALTGAKTNFVFENSTMLPEAYAALPFLMVAQTVALASSLKVGNTPDTPSPTGTVNRVVKGVTIHPFSKEMPANE